MTKWTFGDSWETDKSSFEFDSEDEALQAAIEASKKTDLVIAVWSDDWQYNKLVWLGWVYSAA